MAISKQRKNEMLDEYQAWINRSQALIVTEYAGMTMSQMDDLRRKVREIGGEFHIIKNTLGSLAVKQAGLAEAKTLLEGSTAIVFAFSDAPAMAKTITDAARTNEFLKVKGGYLGAKSMTAEQVKALADMPPLPVMRAQLLGAILAPASQLARTLAEPARALAAVIKAYAEAVPAAVAAPPPPPMAMSFAAPAIEIGIDGVGNTTH